MIFSFRDSGTADIYEGRNSKAARRKLPSQMHSLAGRKLDQLNSAVSLRSLGLPGLRLKKLKGSRRGWHAIRINDQYRICFRWTERGAEDVEITDYH